MTYGARSGSGVRTGGPTAARGLILAALAASLSAGCVSIRMERPFASPVMSGSGFLEVRVFESMSALRNDTPTRRQILCELVAVKGNVAGPPVYRSSEPVWARSDLSPGTYRLRVVGLVDAAGKVRSLGSSDWLDFDVVPGQGVRLSVVVASGRGLAQNVAYGVAWVGVGLLCGSLDEHGVPCSWP
jgi:hypothetical protein